jgi:CRISPR-associated protein Csx3
MFDLKVKPNESFSFIEITLTENIIKPEDLNQLIKSIEDLAVPFNQGIVLSGRLPVWAFGAVIHYFHPAQFVATFDPRLNSGVVVMSHVKEVKIGDLINVE